ncbi:MAG: DUF1972 domain-containing protein [bacterium]
MRIGIIGTRGIPNNYGGFEQFAEHLAAGLVKKGHDVCVYNSHTHPFRGNTWNGVKIIHRVDPEKYIGIPGQFVYDFLCICDSRKRNFDILLQLGYTSSSVWHRLLPGKAKIVTNMDGLEWQRGKYSKSVQRFLKYAESLAVKSSTLLVADSEYIQHYLEDLYQISPAYISYGADIFSTPDPGRLLQFAVDPKKYFLLIARMQPDNNIEEIIKGVINSKTTFPLLIIGNIDGRFGKKMVQAYSSELIRFMGPIFEKETLNQLRYFSRLYFHGHSAGGTNPSLLEAMAASATICANENPFSREVLGQNAYYFSDYLQVSEIARKLVNQPDSALFVENNISRIKSGYAWHEIISNYESAFTDLLTK